jgi:glyoxylase-like metal-dependent hydrolase (beta-lactamase superfamily II)
MTEQHMVPEITPLELAEKLEQGETLHLLDIRTPARVSAGRIDLVPNERFSNIVGSRLATMRAADQIGIDPAAPVTVVCDHGNSSKPATLYLKSLGYDARSLSGGMAAWMLMSLPRELPAPPSLDYLYQFDRLGKGSLSYLLASDGEALIIDPPRDAEPLFAKMQELGVKLVGVADTHVHADYISGAPALSAFLNVPYYLHPADMVYPYDGTPGVIPFDPIEEGSEIQVGRCSVHVQHNPGHTEGSVTFIVDDQVAFTGDFVFVQSVGRPDLAGKAAEWTEDLWASLTRAREQWSPELVIYPAHYASSSERREDRSVGARFGDLLETNEALKIADLTSFRKWVDSKIGQFPEAYREIKAINVGLRQVDERMAEELEIGKNECAVS